MKTVHELTQNELEELRDNYFHLLSVMDDELLGDNTSSDEIPMEKVIDFYDGTYFVEDDFWVNLKS